jgi:inward rectifier potassium channel
VKSRRQRIEDGIEINLGSTSVLKVGTTRYDLRDPYHFTVALRWPHFVALFLSLYFTLNLIFAVLYAAVPGSLTNARPGSLSDAFFFSVETLATVGYGVMAPATTYGHVIASLETVLGLTFTAVTTGIIFVRFSRPRPNLRFADKAVVSSHDNQRTLMVRIAYAGAGMLVGAEAHLDALMVRRSAEGKMYRNAHELRLVRNRTPVVILTWTVMHVIDESSPFYGVDAAGMKAMGARILLSIRGRDRETGADVHDVKPYEAPDVLFDFAYKDVVSFDSQGRAHADLRLLSDVEVAADSPAAAS